MSDYDDYDDDYDDYDDYDDDYDDYDDNDTEVIIIDEYGNINCYNCYDCKKCKNCRNCNNCDSCVNCTHCNNCDSCVNCIHCVNCNDCNDCKHCEYCNNCNKCDGLLRSSHCNNSYYSIECINTNNSILSYGCVNKNDCILTMVDKHVNIGNDLNTIIDLTDDGWRVELYEHGIVMYDDMNNIRLIGKLDVENIDSNIDINKAHIVYGIIYFKNTGNTSIIEYEGSLHIPYEVDIDSSYPTIWNIVNDNYKKYLRENFTATKYNRKNDVEIKGEGIYK